MCEKVLPAARTFAPPHFALAVRCFYSGLVGMQQFLPLLLPPPLPHGKRIALLCESQEYFRESDIAKTYQERLSCHQACHWHCPSLFGSAQ